MTSRKSNPKVALIPVCVCGGLGNLESICMYMSDIMLCVTLTSEFSPMTVLHCTVLALVSCWLHAILARPDRLLYHCHLRPSGVHLLLERPLLELEWE